MDGSDLMRVSLPLTLFIIVVTTLLYFWPRPIPVLLERIRKRVQIIDIVNVSHDVKRFRLSIGAGTQLGLPVGKHISLFAPNPKECLDSGKWNGKEDPDKGRAEIDRRYTPITGNETIGYVDLVIKMYRPGKFKMADGTEVTWENGGKMTQFLDSRKPGDYVELNGPTGIYEYLGKGMFKLPGRTATVRKVGMLTGGAGITPMLQLLKSAMSDPNDTCRFTMLYANKSEDDILCRDLLEELARGSGGRFKLHFTLDFPPAGWKHKAGFITQDMIKELFPDPSDNPLMLMCGPPAMVEHACKKNLEALKYPKSSIVAW